MSIDNSLFRLTDYPLLAALASKQTTATRLDGRACRHLYANTTIDAATVSAHELDLIVALGVPVPGPLDDKNLMTDDEFDRIAASYWEPSPIADKFFADMRGRGGGVGMDEAGNIIVGEAKNAELKDRQ